MITVLLSGAQPLSRRALSAGSVVAVLVVISVAALALVFALSFAMYVRNRR